MLQIEREGLEEGNSVYKLIIAMMLFFMRKIFTVENVLI